MCIRGLKDIFKIKRSVRSPQFSCLGHEWELLLKAFGGQEEGEDEYSIFLVNRSRRCIQVEYSIDYIDTYEPGYECTRLFEPGGVFGKDIDFSQQDMDEDEESNEDEGRVHIIEVRMKYAKYPAPFFPENPSACSTMRELFMDDESANVVFDIKGEEQKSKKSSPKIRKTEPSPTRFYAHRHILKVAAPQLEELSRSSSDTSSPIFEIPDISPEIFDGLLKCIYGHETFDDECEIDDNDRLVFDEEDVTFIKEIIVAADKYGISNLKLEAEARYAMATTITLENMMDHLHFADSFNCALLKEDAIDFIVKNKAEIIEKNMLIDAPGGIAKDVLVAVLRGDEEGRSADVSNGNTYINMSISDLRRVAHRKGLEVDGSREMLISALMGYESDDD